MATGFVPSVEVGCAFGEFKMHFLRGVYDLFKGTCRRIQGLLGASNKNRVLNATGVSATIILVLALGAVFFSVGGDRYSNVFGVRVYSLRFLCVAGISITIGFYFVFTLGAFIERLWPGWAESRRRRLQRRKMSNKTVQSQHDSRAKSTGDCGDSTVE